MYSMLFFYSMLIHFPVYFSGTAVQMAVCIHHSVIFSLTHTLSLWLLYNIFRKCRCCIISTKTVWCECFFWHRFTWVDLDKRPSSHRTTRAGHLSYLFFPSFFVLPSVLSLLLSLTFQNMDPLRFQAGGRRKQLNLGLVCVAVRCIFS